MSEREIQECRADVRRAVMMARENRGDIAALRKRVEVLEKTVEEMQTQIGGLNHASNSQRH